MELVNTGFTPMQVSVVAYNSDQTSPDRVVCDRFSGEIRLYILWVTLCSQRINLNVQL